MSGINALNVQTSDEKGPASPFSVDQLRIGPRLKAARRLQRITLAELSKRTSISISLLSRIENDKSVPSLESLFVITNPMGIDITTFLTLEIPDEFLIKKESRQTVTVVNGEVEIEVQVLTLDSESALLEGFLLKLPPRASGGPSMSHEGEELIYVVKGELEVTVNDSTFVAKRGDSLHYPSHFDHTYRNASDQETVVIWINTPPPKISRLRKPPSNGDGESHRSEDPIR